MPSNHHQTEKSIDRTDDPTNYCPHCGRVFAPKDAHGIFIRGPGEIVWSCPHCKRISKGVAPEENIRLPVIADLDVTAKKGLTTAAIVFPNGARLQYRETSDGHVREEVYSSIDVELNSFSIGLQDEVNTFAAFATVIKRYCELTEPSLRREMPHVAAAVLDGYKR